MLWQFRSVTGTTFTHFTERKLAVLNTQMNELISKLAGNICNMDRVHLTELLVEVQKNPLTDYIFRFGPVSVVWMCLHLSSPPCEQRETRDTLLGFNMVNYRVCKNLWKACVEHHTFFRLETPIPPQKNFFAHYFTLGSKFRYWWEQQGTHRHTHMFFFFCTCLICQKLERWLRNWKEMIPTSIVLSVELHHYLLGTLLFPFSLTGKWAGLVSVHRFGP